MKESILNLHHTARLPYLWAYGLCFLSSMIVRLSPTIHMVV